VGRAVLIDGREFRVAGVLADASRRLHIYDFTLVQRDRVYVPFELFSELAARPDYVGRQSLHGPSTDALKRSSDGFVQLWVELPTPERQRAYAAFVDAEAHKLRPAPVARRPRLSSVKHFIAESIPIPNGFLVFEVCAFIALLACCVNLSRLLIVKFQARAPELAVQRAFGATRNSVRAQYLIEVGLVTLAAILLGLVIAYASLIGINAIVPDRPAEFALDPLRVAIACGMGLGAGMIAGFGPALRTAQSAPAAFLRLQ
jgi:putative ABC transport system permease protein